MAQYEIYDTRTKTVVRDGFNSMGEAQDYWEDEDDEDKKFLKVRQQTTPNERRLSWM